MSDDSTSARTLHCIRREEFEAWRARQPAATAQWLQAHGFDAAPGALLVLPATDGSTGSAVLGIGDPHDPLSYAGAPFALPQGEWEAHGVPDDEARKALQLGWGLGSYRFARYRTLPRPPARLRIDQADAETDNVLAACLRVRDLVNTPADDLGPPQLEDALRELAAQYGADMASIVGDELLKRNFP
ncbi:MAG TPA: leucyl aminopeptidase family protein, partial [Lysobacter sp.]|nr:leucyl aminopeptidase family protein [Lysobacter sp.]